MERTSHQVLKSGEKILKRERKANYYPGCMQTQGPPVFNMQRKVGAR